MHRIITSNKRLPWLDVANVLAMVGVVLFHIPTTLEQPYREVEFVVVNTCFFFLAGYSHGISSSRSSDRVQPARLLLRRIVRLLIPTIFFFGVFYIMWLAVGRRLASDTELWYEPLAELAKGKLHTVVAPYWFVVCLLTMTILHTGVSLVFRNKMALAFALGLMPLLNCLDMPDCYELRYASMFFPIFALGFLSQCHDTGYSHYSLFALGWTLSLTAEYVLTGSISPMPMSLVYGAAYTLGIIWLSHHLASLATLRITKLLRNGALVLLATQNYIIGICRIAADKVTGEADFMVNHIWLKPIVLLLVYGLSIPLIWLVCKHMPFVLGKSRKKGTGSACMETVS